MVGKRVKMKDLCLALLKAESEEEVEILLERNGFDTDDSNIWHPIGDNDNNYGIIGNQQDDATRALIEKVINSVDAMLIAKCWEHGINPETESAPKSMREAAERFFDVRDGRLDTLSAGERTGLADNIHLVAVGKKTQPNYLIIDRGEGQTPERMPHTFLSLGAKNKYGIPFTQGINNSGGTGVLPYCKYQLIISRRHPSCPIESSDLSGSYWGFTLVKRLPPEKPKRPRSMYVYLAPDGEIPRFSAQSLSLLPQYSSEDSRLISYAQDLEHGSCIKLYDFRWRAKSLATTNAREELEKYLYTLCLPVRISETRDYNAHFFQTTLSGLAPNISDHKDKQRLEEGFDPAYAELNLPDIGKIPVHIIVYKDENEKGERIDTKRIPSGIVYPVNGQVHGLRTTEFIKNRLGFSSIAKYMLVAVDCTDLDPEALEELFPTSRDRFREDSDVKERIEKELIHQLKHHDGLRDLNARRRKKELEGLSDEEPLKVLQNLVKADPSLASLFSFGTRIHNPHVPDDNRSPFEGKRFPTYFRIPKEPRGGLTKPCPVNKSCRVEFETDAVNDYFSRANSPGDISFSPEICSQWHLFNGKVTARFEVPSGVSIGDSIDVSVAVTDNSRIEPLTCSFTIKVEKAEEEGGKKPGPRKPKGGQQLAMPKPLPVTRDGRELDGSKTLKWEDHDFDEYSAANVRFDENQGVEVLINMDNIYLLNEIKRERNSSEYPLLRYWYKYGLLLAVLGMLQEHNRNSSNGKVKDKSTNFFSAANENGALDKVSTASSGLAAVIVPIIRQLSEGPR